MPDVASSGDREIPPQTQTVSSSSYGEYISRVESARQQLLADRDLAEANLYSSVDSVNSSAQSRANNAYEIYRSAVESAYDLYNVIESQARANSTSLIEGANTAITSSIEQAGTIFSTFFGSVGSTASTAFSDIWSAFDSALDNADNAYESASEAAWLNGDFEALDDAESDWYASFELAVDEYNSSFVSTASAAEQSTVGAFVVLQMAIEVAESNWTSMVLGGKADYEIAEGSAWNDFLATESTEWNEYLAILTNIAIHQEAEFNFAIAQYENDFGASESRFQMVEAEAWNDYLNGLTAFETPQERQQSTPDSGELQAVSLVALEEPGPRLQNRERGKLPPIDWSKGTFSSTQEKPWKNGPTGDFLEFTIGKNRQGNDVKIKAFDAAKIYKSEWSYNCHGLTFTGSNGLSIVSSSAVQKILDLYYISIPESLSQRGDIIVYKDANGQLIHSCTIVTATTLANGSLDPATTIVKTKNGLNAENPNSTLSSVNDIYLTPGVTITVYKRNG